MTSPAERVWARLDPEARATLERGLSPTDLQTLLLDLSRTRAVAVDPARLVERWRTDRFVRPSTADPRTVAEVVATLWQTLPDDVDGLCLSPVAPRGTCSAVDAADQNRVLSTVRTSEVVSDPTNVLALEAASRRHAAPRGGVVHLAAVHRVLRNQQFPPPSLSHFELFALVSSDRVARTAVTEAALLRRHLTFWSAALDAVVGPDRWHVAYTIIDHDQLRRRLVETVLPELAGRFVEDSLRQQGIGYYATLAFKIMIHSPDGDLEVGDGGFVNWTAQLRADAKERCLISCVATERLAEAR